MPTATVTTDTLAEWIDTRQAGALLCNVCPATVRNHMTRGTHTKDGQVRLRGVILGGQYYTKRAWIEEYIEAIRRATLPDAEGVPAVKPETPDELARRGREVKERVAARLGRRTPLRSRR